MADVLSQAEIDALSSISSGEVDLEEVKHKEEEHKVKIYDFRRPDKFSKDQFQELLQMIHETFSRLVSTMLSAQLRANCQVQVTSVDQITYEEFVRSIPGNDYSFYF